MASDRLGAGKMSRTGRRRRGWRDPLAFKVWSWDWQSESYVASTHWARTSAYKAMCSVLKEGRLAWMQEFSLHDARHFDDVPF